LAPFAVLREAKEQIVLINRYNGRICSYYIMI